MSLTKTAYNHLRKTRTLGGYIEPEIYTDYVGITYITNGNVCIMTESKEYEPNTDRDIYRLVKPYLSYMDKEIKLPTRKELKATINERGIKYLSQEGAKYKLAEGLYVNILYLYDVIVNTKATTARWSGRVQRSRGYEWAEGGLLVGESPCTFLILPIKVPVQ